MSDRPTRARRAYRALLRSYPPEHRARYGEEMEAAFLTLLRLDSERAGALGAARCWVGAAWDCVTGGVIARFATPGKRITGGGEVLGTLLGDLRFAVRSLARRPAFALTAVVTIAIGIGANASVFTIVDGFLLTPLPYDEPDELVAIWAENQGLGWSGTDINAADAMDWRARARTLEDLTVFNADGFNLTGGDTPELVDGLRVMPNFLGLVGREPILGRDFRPEESGAGRDGVTILSDGFWQRRFDRDPRVVGSTLQLDGEPVVVIGVLPPDFLFHDGTPDLLRPWGVDLATTPRSGHSYNAVARMADGVSIEAARQELVAIAADLETEHPENEGWSVSVTSLHTDVVGDVASAASVVLMGAVSFILLMACVNVANLLLARGSGRSREVAVRIALGAGRSRIVRQLLTEAAVIATVGGGLGLLMGVWGYRAIEAALPPDVPPVFEFGMDGSVLAFIFAITVGAALLFGVLPAWRATEPDGGLLRDGARTGRSRRAGRFGSALVVLQTAMAVVLLIGGGLLMRSVSGMRNQELGFDPTNVLTSRVALPTTQYETKEQSEAYWRQVTDRLAATPGVVAVGTTQSHPLMGSNWGQTVRIAGQDASEDDLRTARLTYASPGLFDALGFTMARGRVFTDADGADGPAVAIVNETFVARYLGPEDDPLEATVLAGESFSAPIVGVVHDVIERAVDRPPEPALYVPIGRSDIRTRSIVVRTVGDPTDQVEAVRRAVWAVDADLPIYDVMTMDAVVEDDISGFAVIGQIMAVFAFLSLVLGAVGIYGVTAYAAGQRTSEIGLRLAMGAERTDVVGMVVRQGARRALLGLAIGLALAFLMGGAMAGVLVDVSPRDPLTFASVTAVLAAVSFLGLYIPARRAARVDPVRALTAE